MSELLAYLAGIADGESYIGIKKSTWGMRNRPDVKNPTYHERIQIRMVDEECIKLFKETLGGSYYKEKNASCKSGRPLYCYQASDKIASRILKKLLPYLRIKKRNAELVLKLRKNKESKEARMRGGRTQKRTMRKEVLEFREELYQAIKRINRPYLYD